MEWHCATCGATFPEDRSGRGFTRVMAHLRLTKDSPEGKHVIRGLVDRATGELLVAGANRNPAVARGLIDRKASGPPPPAPEAGDAPGATVITDPTAPHAAADWARWTEPQQPREAWDQRDPKKNPVAPETTTTNAKPNTGMLGDVSGFTIHFPTWVLTYCMLGVRRFRRPGTGARYEWSPKGFGDYVLDFLRVWHERLMPLLLGMPLDAWDDRELTEHLRQAIAAIEGLDTPEKLARWLAQDPAAPAWMAAAAAGGVRADFPDALRPLRFEEE